MNKILFLILIALLSGCSRKIPVGVESGIHPYKMSFEIPISSSRGSSFIRVTSCSIGFRNKDGKTELFDMTESLVITEKVRSLVIRFRVDNPLELNYQVWKQYDVSLCNKSVRNVSKKLWEVNLKDNVFEIHCPLYPENALINFRVVIKNGKEQVLFETWPLSYKVK